MLFIFVIWCVLKNQPQIFKIDGCWVVLLRGKIYILRIFLQYWDPNIATIAQRLADACPTVAENHDDHRDVPGLLITTPNSSCENVMFLQVSVCPRRGMHGRGGVHAGCAWSGGGRMEVCNGTWMVGRAWRGCAYQMGGGVLQGDMCGGGAHAGQITTVGVFISVYLHFIKIYNVTTYPEQYIVFTKNNKLLHM